MKELISIRLCDVSGGGTFNYGELAGSVVGGAVTGGLTGAAIGGVGAIPGALPSLEQAIQLTNWYRGYLIKEEPGLEVLRVFAK